MKKLLVILLIILIFSILNSFTSYSGRTVRTTPKTAPDFSLPSLKGNTVSLKDFRGKLVVLNFWASWAAPCLREMPNLERLNQVYKDSSVQVLGIAVVSDPNDIPQKVRMTGVTYPILLGTKELIARYGSFSDLPTTFIINSQGIIIKELNGSHEYRMLLKAIHTLIPRPSITAH